MSTINLTIDLNTTSEDAVMEVLRILKGTGKPAAAESAKASRKQTAAAPESTAEAGSTPDRPANSKAVTIEELRAVVSAKAKAGHREKIKTILEEAGTDSVTNLAAEKYQEVFTKVNSL